MTEKRAAVLRRVADAVPQLEGHRVRVAVDGMDGAGKTWFGDDLARVLESRGITTARLSIDDFLAPTPVRYARGRRSPEGHWLDSHDLPRFIRAAAGEGDGVIIVDGIFLQRDELQDLWDLRIYLEVPVEVAFDRMAKRDGRSADPAARENLRYSEGQRLYREACDPASRAHLVVDNTDFGSPLLIRRRMNDTPADENRDG